MQPRLWIEVVLNIGGPYLKVLRLMRYLRQRGAVRMRFPLLQLPNELLQPMSSLVTQVIYACQLRHILLRPGTQLGPDAAASLIQLGVVVGKGVMHFV